MPTKTKIEKPFCSISVKKDISKRQIQSLLCSLVESGYSVNWFHDLGNNKLAPGLTIEDFNEGGRFAGDEYFPYYMIVPLTSGCQSVWVCEPVEDGCKEIKFKVGIEQITKGLQLMAEQEPKHFQDIIDEDTDAETADIFGQFVVYGKIIFG